MNDELKQEAERYQREDIIKSINDYARLTGTRHRAAWHRLYDHFEAETDIRLPKEDKLSWCIQEGHIGSLMKTAARVLSTSS